MGRLLGHMHSLPDDKFRRDAGSSWLLALGLVLILGFGRPCKNAAFTSNDRKVHEQELSIAVATSLSVD